MDFELRFTDKEITAWGGMALMKRMLDYMGSLPGEQLEQGALGHRNSPACRAARLT